MNEAEITLRRLLPQAGELTANELLSEYRPWEQAPAERPFVAVNMVHTVDGRAAVDGRTASISSVADRQLFHALRTRFDAVMIGAGTLRIERYGRLVRDPVRRELRIAAGLEPDPLAIVVSASLRLPADLPLLQDGDSRVVIVTSSAETLAGTRASIDHLRFETVDMGAALARLRSEHGVRSILCEGGPHLNASLVNAGLIDELFLTTVPSLAGGAGSLSIFDDVPLGAPLALALQWLLEHEGDLFARYRLGESI
ncbi:MAG TPA: dihydrofolate reductase family protein [Solirubrobacteraceae bacterium]|nr:dihydrofolate reductase family protein [Solirubrobacteraceae bacterium]